MGKAEIYADLLEKCRPVKAPRPWSRFAKDCASWRMPLAEGPILESLRSKHSDQRLIESGVAVQTNGRLTLSTPLSNPWGEILPMRYIPTGTPFDLLTEQGSVRGRLPLRTAIEDHAVVATVEATGNLFAAFQLSDVLRLRSIGLAVAPTYGLEAMTPKLFEQLRFVFGGKKQKPPATPDSFTLVAWNPTRFTAYRSRSVDRVAQCLFDHAAGLGIALHRVFVWTPSRSALKEFAGCLRLGTSADISAAIQRSLDCDRQALVIDPDSSNSRKDLGRCERRLRQVLLSNESGVEDRRRAIKNYQYALTSEVVHPLKKAAHDETNLIDALRIRSIADIAQTAFVASILQRVRLEKSLIENGLSNDLMSVDLRSTQQCFETMRRLIDKGD